MKNWWKEFRNRKLKCDRVGHDDHTERKEYYVYPSKWGVADRIIVKRTICGRCKRVSEPWHETRRQPLTSLSMSQDEWDDLEEYGVYPRLEGINT